jgi:hypothetical protein
MKLQKVANNSEMLSNDLIAINEVRIVDFITMHPNSEVQCICCQELQLV